MPVHLLVKGQQGLDVAVLHTYGTNLVYVAAIVATL